MASQQVPACGRCAFGREKPATRTIEFSIDKDHYKIDLCDEHHRMFERDLGQWTRYGYDDDTYSPSAQMFSVDTIERQRKAAELRALQTQRAIVERGGEQSELVDEPVAPVMQLHAARTIWSMTPHARERMVERDYTEAEILEAALHPETVTESDKKYGPEVRTYRRADVAIAVVPERKIVITCLPREHDMSHHYVGQASRAR